MDKTILPRVVEQILEQEPDPVVQVRLLAM